jgi:class 3 adenylate cyclase
MEVVVPFSDYTRLELTMKTPGHCIYSFHIYPTKEFEDDYHSSLPIVLTVVVAATFFIMVAAFFLYDWFVHRRNNKVVGEAARSNAIVSSLFPSSVHDRLFEENAKKKAARAAEAPTKSRIKNFLASETGVVDDDDDIMYKTKPIADLFPETTILFADISGFTAWSSMREPTQVFTLLETIYRAFDEIARRRRVFKVETIGDCYVAVTGLPDPRKDHAVVMARFARDCMHRMNILVRKLEVTLGPDTADLSMRFGLHSGPVTAGVLRGERSRFQLFGDTMNTASRMESTGKRDRIQISQETADLLIAAGKKNWITPREEKVIAKGKGEMQTYWMAVGSTKDGSAKDKSETASESVSSNGDLEHIFSQGNSLLSKDETSYFVSAKTARLIEWNVDVLLRLLRQVEAGKSTSQADPLNMKSQSDDSLVDDRTTVLDEVKEIISLPTFNKRVRSTNNVDSIELEPLVAVQLQDYITALASMYRDNPFHNFEHASHVTMSVVKLLSRIVAPVESSGEKKVSKRSMASSLHDHTYGITSDPLTQFACVFSALIHDVDHTGVPNAQLVKEQARLSVHYKGKSVAEQNSVDLAWDLLMDDDYSNLRAAIYNTEAEKKRFRQLVVNSVMATDIMDKDLKTLRNARWEKAFSNTAEDREESKKDAIDRKATIVIEHLIQASDVAHTMQHWHVYRKWNARLFEETYKAYLEGRSDTDPSENWYQGEIGFYDFYIIPLAKKLKDCGVFGVSSDEYLNYAMKNRQEWEARGREVVEEMVEQLRPPEQAPEPGPGSLA